MAASTEEGTEMRRKKRFTIRLVALGLALTALSAAPAQAKLDEGVNGLQPPYTPQLFMADDIRRPSPLRAKSFVTATDVKHGSQVPTQSTVARADDGIEVGTLGISAIVLLLAAGAGFVAIQQVNNRKLAGA